MIRTGILTVSDKGSQGLRADEGGPKIRSLLPADCYQVETAAIVPDEIPELVNTLVEWADRKNLDLIFTTGGTGLSPRDLTPEATEKVIEREIPGMAEAMRREGMKHTPLAQLSRGIVGVRGETLIINLPGGLKAIEEILPVILPAIPHALEKIKGDSSDCGR
ncbi:MAG: MogA/MoaB family molybdenum cofactor biosynthesis protein [Deltaproteobacteria bacterium]|nr:MogA/MoaB family molybdenum cofactor biosynthesis protein [Deltaproteobacteria bacterium]